MTTVTPSVFVELIQRGNITPTCGLNAAGPPVERALEEAGAGRDEMVRRWRRLLLADRITPVRQSPRLGERRRRRRVAIPWPLELTPAGASGRTQGEPLAVVGRSLSAHGVDFYSLQPLPDRFVRVRFPGFAGEPAWQSLLRLQWCRFTTRGWYENGGRFVDPLRNK